ncbi:glutaredoxin family protein [Aquibacillus koreensis]|uniref:Glutaredoxin family protein n=1 Tax=Aquibacillus koreensis TaxID=279446 RepID=A0A9X3WKT5_9BACI|nr:glutaredoxin family protein [Aquibacillus koreensis]MCT2536055.1 glutaredoxin family protein [Aquibacillus koreensis]MDC3420510.1 glutaredoxin family protein [Aquibacillus koreensis]
MKLVILYTKVNCPLCEDAKQLLEFLQLDHPFELKEVDIYQNDDLLEKYQLMIPVVEIDGVEVDYGQVSIDHISKHLV